MQFQVQIPLPLCSSWADSWGAGGKMRSTKDTVLSEMWTHFREVSLDKEKVAQKKEGIELTKPSSGKNVDR